MSASEVGYQIEDEWCRLIPLLHQILSGARTADEFPDPTRVQELREGCAVWETLHYLLRSLLGWSNPAKGLAWWYQAQKPTLDSELLRITMQLWGQGDALDFYTAWAWKQEDGQVNDGFDATRLFADENWWTAFRARREPAWQDPYYGGTNPLHLGHSDFDPFGGASAELDLTSCWELHHDIGTRRAVLVVDHIGVWRGVLKRAGARLPDLGNHSWYVQIFDRQYGSLGTFRRSRVTGRWFQGKHSIHVVGNTPQVME